MRLNCQARMDITWWYCLLQHWNGISFFPPAAPSFHVYLDASGSFGCGAYSPELSSWFQLSWPQSWSTVSISAKELVPIVVAAAIWGHHWSGSYVCSHCENDAVVVVIENRNTHQDLLVQLLRCLFVYASRLQFYFSASHIPEVHNVVTDAISRDNISLLSSFVPQAQQVGVPAPVVAFLMSPPSWESPDWIARFVYSLSVPCL